MRYLWGQGRGVSGAVGEGVSMDVWGGGCGDGVVPMGVLLVGPGLMK